MSLILWVLSFQFLDIAITKANPTAAKDEVRDNRARLLLFGGYMLALVVAFIIPKLTIIILGLVVLIMGAGLLLSSNEE